VAVAGPINRTWLLRRYLNGVDITDDFGLEFHDSQWDLAAASGIEYVEMMLGITVLDRGEIIERQDFDIGFEGDWRLMSLNKRPVQSVAELKFVMGGSSAPSNILTVPTRWIYLADDIAGQIQIVPTADSEGGMFVQNLAGLGLWMGSVTAGVGSIPGFYQARYRAGWYGGIRVDLPVTALVWSPESGADIRNTVSVELNQRSGAATQFVVIGVDLDTGLAATETVVIGASRTLGRTTRRWSAITSVTLSNPGTVGVDANGVPKGVSDWTVCVDTTIPANILHVAGMWSSMWCLNTAGDLVAGAGIASASKSVDGLSQSVSTTSSATNAGYGSRIIQYKKDISQAIAALQGVYGRAFVAA